MIKGLILFFLIAAPSLAQRLILNDGSSGNFNLGSRLTLGGQPQIIRLAQPQPIITTSRVTTSPQIIRTIRPSPIQAIRTVQPASVSRNEEFNDESPKPYAFSYATDDEAGTRTSREEQSDGNGGVRGSYSYTDPDGVYRTVEYIADADGYRATVRTNEPGTAKLDTDPADVILEVEDPPAGLVERYATIRTTQVQPTITVGRQQSNFQVIRSQPQVVRVVQPQLSTISVQPQVTVRRQQQQAYKLVPVDADSGDPNVIYLNSLRGRRA